MDTKSKGWLWGQKVLDTIHSFTTRSQIADGKFLSDKRTLAKCAAMTGGKKRLWMGQIGCRIIAPHVFAVGSAQVLIKRYYLEHRGGSAAAPLFHSVKVSFPPRWKSDCDFVNLCVLTSSVHAGISWALCEVKAKLIACLMASIDKLTVWLFFKTAPFVL